MASAVDLAELRRCMSHGCEYSVPSGVTDIDHILRSLNNHILGVHPVVSKTEGGRTAKSTATLPILLESITETQYQAQYQRYCISCKLSDDDIKNQIFEAVPTILADQICIDLDGTESKDVIFGKI